MGCHTWFYKKIDVSYEEAKNNVILKLQKNINCCQEWVDNPHGELYLEVLEFYPEWTTQNLLKTIEIEKRQLRMIKEGLCKEAVMNRYSEASYIKSKGHYKSIELGDLFKIGNYPDDILFSLEETLDFIEKNKDKIYFYHHDVNNKTWLKMLEEFWQQYPDGMIKFG